MTLPSSPGPSQLFWLAGKKVREGLVSDVMWQTLHHSWHDAIRKVRLITGDFKPIGIGNVALWGLKESYYTCSKYWTSCLSPVSNFIASKYGSPTCNFHPPPPFLPCYVGLHVRNSHVIKYIVVVSKEATRLCCCQRKATVFCFFFAAVRGRLLGFKRRVALTVESSHCGTHSIPPCVWLDLTFHMLVIIISDAQHWQ